MRAIIQLALFSFHYTLVFSDYKFVHDAGARSEELMPSSAAHPQILNGITENEFAWIVVITMSGDEEVLFHNGPSYYPVCMGMLITRSDVLTTCSCVSNVTFGHRDEHLSSPSKLLAMAKTRIVEWDSDIKVVTYTHVHDSCKKCGKTSYNDLALLTVEIFNIIYGIVETVPREFFKANNDSANPLLDVRQHENCFVILNYIWSEFKPLDSMELAKQEFQFHEGIPPMPNDLNTTVVFGKSNSSKLDSEMRLPGSPLICRRNENFVPVGIYLGLYCPENCTLDDLTNGNVFDRSSECRDVCPTSLSYVVDRSKCPDKSQQFEMVMLFDNLQDWLEDNTFEPLDSMMMISFRASGSFIDTPYKNFLYLPWILFYITSQNYSRR